MKDFLAPEGACFYHITRKATWLNNIQKHGLIGDSKNRIFVSRTDDRGVLLSIALNQILKLDEYPDLVILRLKQETNAFLISELSYDSQAIEITMPFQSIIYRANIPVANIEYVDAINLTTEELGTIANKSDHGLPQKPFFHEALNTIYVENDCSYKLTGEMRGEVWVFEKINLSE